MSLRNKNGQFVKREDSIKEQDNKIKKMESELFNLKMGLENKNNQIISFWDTEITTNQLRFLFFFFIFIFANFMLYFFIKR